MTPTEKNQARFVLERIGDAWTKCREAGVDEHVLQTATITAAISQMVSEAGTEGAVSALMELIERTRSGDFSNEFNK